MEVTLVCASHSPLIYFPARESENVVALRSALSDMHERIVKFDPQLVVLFGCDHYGGQHMASMPAFCVGVEATAIDDVGGTPGTLDVPRDLAVALVRSLRDDDVDVAVSYAMEVDHGFSQALQELCGGPAAYRVLPVFVSCLQPPFVPFKRARALGNATARFLSTQGLERVLILGTGGLSHDPSPLFPAIDDVGEAWRPYQLLGKAQNLVSQQSWIDYEIEAHEVAAQIIVDESISLDDLCIREEWDRAFLDLLCSGDLADFDAWQPATVVAEGGFGAMETLSWVAATQATALLTGARPQVTFHRPVREVGIGFAVATCSASTR